MNNFLKQRKRDMKRKRKKRKVNKKLFGMR